MLINCSCLTGQNLNLVEEAHILIENGVISEIGDGYVSNATDLRGKLALPGLINAHTHIGDSFAKEAAAGLRVHEACGRDGVKWELYKKAARKEIIEAMRESAEEMQRSGTTCFCDFREGGPQGLTDLHAATADLKIKKVVLGRDLCGDLSLCDGLGINLYQKNQAPPPKTRKGKILAIHAGEVSGEVKEALSLDPDVIIHFTHTDLTDVKKAAEKRVSVVVCPRSNAALRVGFPPVKDLLESKVNVALGTDNVMINAPDMWREMEFLYKTACLTGYIEPPEVLKMATVNGAAAFRLPSGSIEKGRAADILFIDYKTPNLRHSRDIVASLVSRGRPEDVYMSLVNGKTAFTKAGI